MSEAGLYIHIPFCARKCPYCHFYSITNLELMGPFIEGLVREMEMYRGAFPPFSTIYVGGGSPSLLPLPFIETMLNGVFRFFSLTRNPEVTVEVNPADGDRTWFKALAQLGVNRLIIGVQSFDDGDLAFLGRRHRAEDAVVAVKNAQEAGFVNIGIDLIYGLPQQSIEVWEDNLKQVINLAIPHVSCYELTLEEGTPLDERAKRGELNLPDEEMKWQFFQATDGFFSEHGFIHYEVSNFARDDAFYSRHNLHYWQRVPYLGLGPSAHSFDGHHRWWNTSSLTRYLRKTEKGVKPIEGKEEITREDAIFEEIFLGLRTRDGVNKELVRHSPLLESLLQEGYLIVDHNRLRPTPKGLALADRLAVIICPN